MNNMNVIERQITVVEQAMNDLITGAQEELDFQNAKGWNDKGITIKDVKRVLCSFAVDNIETMEALNSNLRIMTGDYAVLAMLYGAENFDPVPGYDWNLSALNS